MPLSIAQLPLDQWQLELRCYERQRQRIHRVVVAGVAPGAPAHSPAVHRLPVVAPRSVSAALQYVQLVRHPSLRVVRLGVQCVRDVDRAVDLAVELDDRRVGGGESAAVGGIDHLRQLGF